MPVILYEMWPIIVNRFSTPDIENIAGAQVDLQLFFFLAETFWSIFAETF